LVDILIDRFATPTDNFGMGKFRLEAVADLARQMAFTPLETRAAQLISAEGLLHALDPQKAYPIDFVVFRITGYQPKTDGNSYLLTGLALQHDLGLLIEHVSAGLNLDTAGASEPVLAIKDVTERFNVTSKTIQRWRRCGLPARLFTFPDGKRRVGFFLSSVERFINAHPGQSGCTTICTAMADDEQAAIVRNARRLVSECGCTEAELLLRLGKKFHRTPMTILHTLRRHDAGRPECAILPQAAAPLSEAQAARIVAGRADGMGISELSRELHRRRSIVYRALVSDRAARLSRRKVSFIDDPLYHDADADRAIRDIVSQQELGAAPAAVDARVPRDLPPYLRDLYRTPLLTPARERALFLKFNFHKYQFVMARRRLEPEFAGARELAVLEQHLRVITATKNEILQANLRLVVSIARRHVRPGLGLMELISEGNIILMRAVEGFDIHKGNRLSTYATLALMKGFAQAVPMLLASGRGSADLQLLAALPDARADRAQDHRLDRDEVRHLLGRLSSRERQVLIAHYGLGSDESATYEEVGQRMGLSKQSVRKIEQTALAKLRERAE
jgi:RNA polymerase sigma factor (sigma-70 family)